MDVTPKTNQVLHNRRSMIALLVILMIFIIGFALVIYFLRDQVWQPLSEISFFSLISILILTVLTTFCYTVMVYWLLRCSGFPTTLWKSFLVLSTSLSANYMTPVKVGIPLRVYLYNHFIGVPVATGTALITAEAVIGILIPALIASLCMAFLFPSIGLAPTLILIGLLLLGLVFILYARIERFEPILSRFPASRFLVSVLHFLVRVQGAMRSLSFAAFLGLVLLDFLMIVLQVLRLWVVVNIFDTSHTLLEMFGVFTISLTAGNVSLLPMGIGVWDTSFTFLMMQLGISKEIAISVAAIQRLFSPGWPLILGLISANILGIKEFSKKVTAQLE